MSKSQLYLDKGLEYFSNIRWEIISFIPEGSHRILEIGCGNGANLRKLRELGKADLIFGIEINENCTKELSKYLDGFFIGDVELLQHPFSNEYFDYIIFGDVLEHLIDPIKVIKKYKNLLKNGGYIIASIPNIKYISILINLILFDKFEYTYSGVLDKTHLRFFTKKEIMKMFKSEKFEIIQIKPKLCSPFLEMIDNGIHKLICRSMPFSSFFAVQYIIKAKKK